MTGSIILTVYILLLLFYFFDITSPKTKTPSINIIINFDCFNLFVSKEYHLPALLFILFFGLFMGNLNKLTHFKFIENLKLKILNKEVRKFKELTTEFTFLIRALFFLSIPLNQKCDLANRSVIIQVIVLTAIVMMIGFMVTEVKKEDSLKLKIRPN